MKPGTGPSRLVFFRTDHIGDLVLTLPAVARMAAAFPGIRMAGSLPFQDSASFP